MDRIETRIKVGMYFFCFFILLPLILAAQTTTNNNLTKPEMVSQDSSINVTYIANEGFFISYCGKKILIDALFIKKLPEYAAPTDELLHRMETAQPPFDNIDLILATHIHSDHFNRNSVKECLLNNPNAVFISTPQVVQFMAFDTVNYAQIKHQIKTENLDVEESAKLNCNGIDITMYRTNHSNNNLRDPNFMYLIDIYNKKIFHEGDSDNSLETFRKLGLDKENIDIAFVHGWFALESETRKIITDCLKPKQTVLMHIPNDELNNYFNRIQEIREVIPNVTIFRNSLEYEYFK